MRVPLIFTLNASDAQSGPYPAISAEAKILYDPAEQGGTAFFSADKVECSDFLPGRTEIVFWLDLPVNGTWKIGITNKRITFENAYSKGMIGKAKIKPGRLTAGHIPFDAISHLSAFYSNEGKPLVLCSCYRQDGTRSAVIMHGDNIDSMRSMLLMLQDKIMTYLKESGKLIAVSDGDQSKLGQVMRQWSLISGQAWKDKNDESTVVVPNKAYTQVPNSRVL